MRDAAATDRFPHSTLTGSPSPPVGSHRKDAIESPHPLTIRSRSDRWPESSSGLR